MGTLATPAAKHDVVLQLASPQKLVDHFAKSFIEEPEDWLSAEMSCVKLGGHLATVESFGDNRRAWSFCDAWRCWIGLNDRGREGEFVWTDGRKLGKSFDGASRSAATSAVAAARSDRSLTTHSPPLPSPPPPRAGRVHTTYSNWAPGEPNNGGYKADAKGKDEDCVYAHGATYHPFQRQQQWGDHPCAEKNPYVCQIRIGGAPKAAAAAAAVPKAAAAAAVRRRRAPAPSSSAQRGGLPQDRLEPVPTPAHTEAPATISMILSLGGLSKSQFDAKAGYRQSFQAAIAQLASFDGVPSRRTWR